LENHAGEVCFPGGRPEKEDASLEATALREASEEMGISSAQVLGRLSSMPLYTSNYRLEPFVGIIGDDVPVADGSELVAVLPVSMKDLLTRPRINALAWNDAGTEALSPVFELSNRLMFGATAYVLYELMTLCAPIVELEMPPMEKGPYTWDDIVESTKVSAE
jgi:8-oxo-dGTP pyrophosphatase MutT (NUDIX family)